MALIKLDLSTSYPIMERRISKVPLIGYRGWKLHDGRLCSLTADHFIEGPICSNTSPPVINWKGFLSVTAYQMAQEERKNYVGFFCYKNPTLTFTYLSNCGVDIWTRVSLFGTVIEHEFGFRAQSIRIDKMFLSGFISLSVSQFRPLESRYQCDLCIDSAESAMHRDYQSLLSSQGI